MSVNDMSSKNTTNFLGYCFDNEGHYTPAVVLKDIPDVIAYCKLQGLLNYEVRITDCEDYIVMQVIDKVIVWPDILKGIHIRELEDR